MSARSAVAIAALVAAACARDASLSVSAQTSIVPSSSATSAATARSGSLDLGNGIAVDRIRISFTQVALDDDGCEKTTGSGGGGGGNGNGNGNGHCKDEFGELEADLPAGNLDQTTQLVETTARPRTFNHVQVGVGPTSAGSGSSLIVDGTVDGKPFSFVSSFAATIDVVTNVVVRAGVHSNVTVSMDPSSWFGGTGASRLDPTVSSNQSAIEGNVVGSITAFEDDNDEHHHTGSGAHGE